MKRLFAITAMLACAACQPALASTGIPTDLNQAPEKFCFVAGVMSASIMQRVNIGIPIEVIYDEVNALSDKALSVYLNETTTIAYQFSDHSSGPVPIKEFAAWNYQRCMGDMKPKG